VSTLEQLDVMAELLTRELDELRHIRAALDVPQPTESRSSCTVKTSTRGQDLEVKSYADGLLAKAVNEALGEYARGMRELQALQASQWQQTVDALSERETAVGSAYWKTEP
jgi:hypothetical protein